MKNTVFRKILIIIALATLIIATVMFAVSCGDDGKENTDGKPVLYTMTFDTDDGTEIEPISAEAGATIVPPANPEKSGLVFAGWYSTPEREGEPVTVPTVMPDKDVTYYAKFVLPPPRTYSVIYDFNLATTTQRGNIDNSTGVAGATVQVKNGAAFNPLGYIFLGWTTDRGGTLSLSGGKAEGQYAAGDSIVLGEKDITLYAQWAREFTDARGESEDKICVYNRLIGKGLGAAILVREGKENKLGFITAASETQSHYDEFEFVLDEDEGGSLSGRLDYNDYTYITPDDVEGMYMYYDYVDRTSGGLVIALDGYGYATLTSVVGSAISVEYSGNYKYDKKYGDYKFDYTDSYGRTGSCYFMLEAEDIENTQLNGYFRLQGMESGSYLWYDNGELLNYRLDLSGYGSAVLYSYDSVNDVTETVATGTYSGTDMYDDYQGEWIFTPIGGTQSSFKFIVTALSAGNEAIAIYIQYNQAYDTTFNAASGDGTLYINGYGMAVYTAGGDEYEGSCTVGETLITFVPYIEDGDNVTVGGTMYFNVNWTAKTFKVNTEGFVIDGTTLTGYRGSSQIVVIPDDITVIADGAFSNLLTDVSLISVTIPAGVTSIGKNAFENNYSLRRAVFLSTTPIEIDFTSENNPFRWPSGSFIIVVPEGSQEAYRTAWTDCPYTIKGSEEVTRLPEFEIENGVLVRYNKQQGSADVLDIKIPDGVTEIADYVFRGSDFIRSMDLNGVTKVGEQAFYGCQNLVTVKFTEVTVLGDGAFMNCAKLSTSGEQGVVELPKIVTLGAGAFQGCGSLRRIKLGVSLANIGDMAFRECQINEGEPTLFIELTGNTAPTMGNQVTTGNISVRIQVKNIDVALDCFATSCWNKYIRHLYIPSGDERGMYMCGAELLELDGRAMFQSSTLMMYVIDGNKITFYVVDEQPSLRETIEGTIIGNTITAMFNGVEYELIRVTGVRTYTTADGDYTLECNPLDLLIAGEIDVKFNGVDTKLNIGYRSRTINGFTDSDGKKYDITISFDGNTLVVNKTAAAYHIKNITAADGSVINLHFTGTALYIYGELKIKVGENSDGTPKYLVWSDYGAVPQTPSENVYTFTRSYLNNVYNITVTVSSDYSSFTYTYTVS